MEPVDEQRAARFVIIGWCMLWLGIAHRFGWWLLPAGIGLGLLICGIGALYPLGR